MEVITSREERRYRLDVWLSGTCPELSPRWPGDDGRRLRLEEWQWWPDAIQAAEEAEFKRLDAIYEEWKRRDAQE